MNKTPVAIIGSGNIGTDLMYKIAKLSNVLEVAALVGIDPDSDGLARAREIGIATVDKGVEGLLELPHFDQIKFAFDATSAGAHVQNFEVLKHTGVTMIDLTPAAIGPFVVPPVNLSELSAVDNVNMVTCGGQATIPIVAAVSSVAPVHYAEIVASIASRSAGPGTRANIDEFTETTARAIEQVGGAARGKAIIILNPAEPPLIMRDTVMCIVDDDADRAKIADSVTAMVDEVRRYVPGYTLKQEVHFRDIPAGHPDNDLVRNGESRSRLVVSVFLEVEGAAHYLPPFAGNLDIMTSAAMRTAENIIEVRAK
jgi:acetaldehyde dehydrogenase